MTLYIAKDDGRWFGSDSRNTYYVPYAGFRCLSLILHFTRIAEQ
jgi:hypothetical protein